MSAICRKKVFEVVEKTMHFEPESKGFFSVRSGAQKFIDDNEMDPKEGMIYERDTIVIDGQVYLLENSNPIEVNDAWEKTIALKASGLAKLTKEEREALGL
jgi:hypothetical protein